jgi:hypothetical protein
MLPQWVDRSGGKQLYVPSVPCMSQQSTHRVSMSVRFTSAWPSTPKTLARTPHGECVRSMRGLLHSSAWPSTLKTRLMDGVLFAWQQTCPEARNEECAHNS